MRITALIVGTIGGLCAVWGVLIGVDVLPSDLVIKNLNWSFWFGLATILLLGSIAMFVGHRPGD